MRVVIMSMSRRFGFDEGGEDDHEHEHEVDDEVIVICEVRPLDYEV